jgi:RNA polymerase sigma-70 factor (ECF subfamily)
MALDGPAFEDAYRAHAARLRAVAFGVLRDRDAAEDAVHAALMRVWGTGAYRPERGPLLPYLIACVRREGLDTFRGSKRRHLREVRAGAGAAQAVDETAALDPLEARRVGRAVERLSGVQRDVIVRAYYGRRTLAEVAQETNLPLGTVKSRLAAALRRLSTELTEGSP